MKTVEFTRDENDVIVGITVDGKKVKPSFVNAFKKAQTTPYFRFFVTGVTVQNPYSGEQVHLEAFEATVYTFCKAWEREYNFGRMAVPIQTFDNMRYFFNELNPSAYMTLLD